MHVSFIAYGKRDQVELLLRDMEATKHKFILKKGDEEKVLWVQGQVRVLPFGVYEYVFPKEDLDAVLFTLDVKKDNPYINKTKAYMLRKMIKHKKIPEYNKDNYYRWVRDWVGIIPIGVKEDGEYTDPFGESEGWTHEAI